MFHVKVGESARKEMTEALSGISQAVGSTLGPGGRPFAFDKMGPDMRLQATMTKDGLTVLRALGFQNPAPAAVLQYCKQSAAHSVIASGDGTTSTIVLASAVAEAIGASATKMQPQAFARLIEKEADAAIEAIKAEAITDDDVPRLVALTSTNGDEELTNVVLEAIERSSAFGTIVTEKNPGSKSRYRIVTQDGYSHCYGYDYNNTLAWSASEKAASNETIEWEKPRVAIFNGHLMADHQVDPILVAWDTANKAESVNRNLVIFAYDIGDAVANKLLIANRTLAKFGLSVFVVKPRLSSEINSGLQVVRDLAAFTGVEESKVIDGGNYTTVSPAFFGTCDKIKISPVNTVLMGRASNHWVEKRVQQNANIIAEARAQHDKEVTAIRNSQLTEGLVKVEVGGGLMPDLQERADRLDDASKAVQACMQNGALPGCGASYIRAAQLANVGPELQAALRMVHGLIMANRGVNPVPSFEQGETVYISESGAVKGDCKLLKVMDACDTVCAVIKNGVSLGVKIATLGGYSLRVQGASGQNDMLMSDY